MSSDIDAFIEKYIPIPSMGDDGNFCIKHTEKAVLYREYMRSSAGGDTYYHFRNLEKKSNLVNILSNIVAQGDPDVPFDGALLQGIDYFGEGERYILGYNRKIYVFNDNEVQLQTKIPAPTLSLGFLSENRIYYTLRVGSNFEVRTSEFGRGPAFVRNLQSGQLQQLQPLHRGSCTGYVKVFPDIAKVTGGLTIWFDTNRPTHLNDRNVLVIDKNGEKFEIDLMDNNARCVQVNSDSSRMLVKKSGRIDVYDLKKVIETKSVRGARLATIEQNSLSTAAFFVGSGEDIVTSHWDNRVMRWQISNGRYTGKEILTTDNPVRYAEPNSDGSRLVILENIGAGMVNAFLYSLSSNKRWMNLTTNYKWVGLTFDANEDVVFMNGTDSDVHIADLLPLSAYVNIANNLLSKRCQVMDHQSFVDSKCWPDLTTDQT